MPRVSSHFALQDPRSSAAHIVLAAPANVTSTGATATLTPAQILSGWIWRSGPTAGFTDTLPTAQQLCEAIQGVAINCYLDFRVRNTSGFTQTLAAGKGGTTNGAMTCATVSEKSYRLLFTNVTPGLEAYTVYSMGAAGAY